MNRRAFLGLAAAAVALPARAQGTGLVVFAAASLKTALDEVAANAKPAPRLSYAASSALARQIEQGAPADIFVSADTDWMDYVEKKGLIKRDTRVNLLGNKIVLIAPRDAAGSGLDLVKQLGDRKLAMANVEAVPAGKYGKAALEKLGLWDGVKGKVAQSENVRAALLLVARGEAPLGVVYATDAAAETTVRIVGEFPVDSHPPIIYPAALTTTAKPEAAAFLDRLKGGAARQIFERQGFTVLLKSASAT